MLFQKTEPLQAMVLSIQNRTCQGRPLHLAGARPFCHLKAPLGLSLLCFAAQTLILRCKMLVGKSQTLELHCSDAGLAFLQNALSALRRSAQPSRYRDDHRVWDSSQQVNEHGEILISCANLGLCTYKAPACCGCIRQEWYHAALLAAASLCF